MKTITIGIALVAVALIAMPPVRAQDLKEKLAAAKQAAAQNQKALRSYSWLEKTELSLKGEVKNTKVDMCRYGPDGRCRSPQLSSRRLRSKNAASGARSSRRRPAK